jgi:hypothetical protein
MREEGGERTKVREEGGGRTKVRDGFAMGTEWVRELSEI